MITISIMALLKIISLTFLGILMLVYMLSTFSTKDINFISVFVAFSLMAIPFIYILLN